MSRFNNTQEQGIMEMLLQGTDSKLEFNSRVMKLVKAFEPKPKIENCDLKSSETTYGKTEDNRRFGMRLTRVS